MWGVVILALPLALPLAVLVDLVRQVERARQEREVLSTAQARCPRGDTVPTGGAFRCASCGLVSERHGFAPCPHCGASAAAIGCPCGLPIRNPLWRPEDA